MSNKIRIKANSIEEYLSKLSDDRKIAISSLRKIIVDNLPKGYEETLEYGRLVLLYHWKSFL